jgi:hypothetical protein
VVAELVAVLTLLFTTIFAALTVAHPTEVQVIADTWKLVVDKLRQPKEVAVTEVTVTVPPEKLVVDKLSEPKDVTVTVVPERVIAVVVEALILFMEAVAKVTAEVVDTAWGIDMVVLARTEPETVTAILEPIRLPVTTTAGLILVAVK